MNEPRTITCPHCNELIHTKIKVELEITVRKQANELLVHYKLTLEEVEKNYVVTTNGKIAAIKALRQDYPNIDLRDAKALIEYAMGE